MSIVQVTDREEVIGYNCDELSLFERASLHSNEKDKVIRLTKIFIALNGATGSSQSVVHPSLAGFFSFNMNNRIYGPLNLVRTRIQVYQRHTETSVRDLDRVIDDFNTIKNFWNHMVISTERTGVSDDPDPISYRTATRDFQEMDLKTLRNYEQYTGPSWIQWFKYIKDGFEELRIACEENEENYTQGWIGWSFSFLNPMAWYRFVANGCQPNSTVAENNGIMRDRVVIPKRNIALCRLEEIETANNAFSELVNNLEDEKRFIENETNRQHNPLNLRNTQLFKDSTDRLFSIIRDRVGRIESDSLGAAPSQNIIPIEAQGQAQGQPQPQITA